MNKLFRILIFIFAAILQLTLMPIFNVSGIYPNIVLIAVIVLVLMDLEEDAFLLAGFGGLILDLGGSLPFGINIFLLIGFVFAIRAVVRRLIPEMNFFIVAAALFIISIVFASIINFILNRFLIINILIDGLYSVILGLIFFWQLHKFQGHKQIIKMEKF